MARVLIRNKKTGKEKRVMEREGRILVQLGRWEYATATTRPPAQAPPEPEPVKPTPTGDLEDMTYNDLRSLAAERGIKPEGRTKDDYLRALRYETRRMDAED